MTGGEPRRKTAVRRASRPFPPIGWATALGLIALVGVVAAPSGAFPAAQFVGATHQPTLYKYLVGCGGTSGVSPTWSRYTGDGKLKVGAGAYSCPASSGISSGSNSYVSAQTAIFAPVALPSGPGGVNVTWNITVSALSTGWVNGTLACPSTRTVSDTNLGFTWYNITNTTSYCAAIGTFQLYAAAYLYDFTSATWYSPSNYWGTFYNTSGQYNYSWYSNVTFSNRSYWGYNASFSSTYSWGYGARNTLNATAAPTWFINGTFNASHTYSVYTYVGAAANAYVYGYHHGRASVLVNAGKSPDHVDLRPFAVW